MPGIAPKAVNWVLFEKVANCPVIKDEEVADILGCSLSHLQRKVLEEYHRTLGVVREEMFARRKNDLFTAMWLSAMGTPGRWISMNGKDKFEDGRPPNVAAQIWLSKNLLGWTDKSEVLDRRQQPPQVDLDNLSSRELEVLEHILERSEKTDDNGDSFSADAPTLHA